MPPPIRVVLPDGQEAMGRLHARQQTANGWRYWTGIPAWQNVDEDGTVGPGEYRVWLSPEQAFPVDGVSYDDVVTRRLPPSEPPRATWAFAVQRVTNGRGRVTGTIVHEYECEDSPRGPSELDAMQALDALAQPGARACKKCDAAKVLEPVSGRTVPDDDEHA